MQKKVVIIGAGGHGRVVADVVRACGDIVVGFLDDDPSLDTLGAVKDYANYSDCLFFAAIGNPEIREAIVQQLDVDWYTAIHPSAIVSPSARVEEGTVVMPNAVINAGAHIGKHCIINSGAIVEHDNQIEEYVHISVGARLGGTVQVGKKTWIGIGATVSNRMSICGGCMIGAGAVVVENITEQGIYVGVPARRQEP